MPLSFTHRFLPATGSDAPTLLLLHGTGGNEDDLLDLGRMLAPEAALLSPRGKVVEHGMPRFFRRLAEGVFDVPDLIARTNELGDFVTTAAGEYKLDAARLIAVGFSNGANIAAAMLLLRPEILRGAVLLRAMVPLEPEEMPKLDGVSVLIESGREDPIVPVDQPEQLAGMLRSAGAEVTLTWQEAGHNLTQQDLLTAREWLTTHS
jgi:predicted esterase